MQRTVYSAVISTGLCLSACTPGKSSENADSGTTAVPTTSQGDADGDGGAETGEAETGDGGADDGGDGGETTGAGDDGGTTGSFIRPVDGGGSVNECDIFMQDCDEGDKCMPWANDGGSSWNATKCSPLDANPKQPGDDCTVEGTGVSGIDDCDVSSMCWDVDPMTNQGYCVSFCSGSLDNPTCEDPETICAVYNDGVLPLCLAGCDPLLQGCPNEDVCVPAPGDKGFVCVLDASGDLGAFADPCEYVNVCDPGLFCANATGVPGCVGSQGCCSEFCDLTDADPSGACSGLGDGQECVAWWEDPAQVPPGLEHVGACVIPP